MGMEDYNAYVEAQNEANALYEAYHWLVYGEGPNGERFEHS